MKHQKKYIIRKKKDFENVYGFGKKLVGNHTVVYYLDGGHCSGEKKYPKIGLTVSKKIGGAVQRNKAKRWYRDIFHKISQAIPPGFEMVWVARSGIVDAGYRRVSDELVELLRRNDILS